ncbi:MAG: hypothetical protein AAFQ53_00190, partial [Bacteroidota bacterium]
MITRAIGWLRLARRPTVRQERKQDYDRGDHERPIRRPRNGSPCADHHRSYRKHRRQDEITEQRERCERDEGTDAEQPGSEAGSS